ncbi:MAG: MFS transporter [Candidatus Lambdaproteobacteria bacterium]|nr:MFS transporter [Candidatus Lambdaproteobacteria bacterium]
MPVEFFRQRGIYYGWVTLTVTFITVFVVIGFRYAFGVLYVAILEDTGWLRAETAGIFSTAMITYMFTAILSGALIDRLGPRILFPIGCVVMSAGLALCATISSIWEFYLYYGVLVGLGYVFLGFIPHISMLPRWFVRRRGFASAVLIAGVGMGSLVVSVACDWMLGMMGWRAVFLVFSVIVLLVLLPLTLYFHRDSPAAIGLHPDNAPSDPAVAQTAAAPEGRLLDALGTPTFWLLALAVATIGVGQQTIAVHQTRLLVDMGYGLSLAAGLFGITGLFRSIGGFIWGPLSDRFGTRRIIMIAAATGFAGIVVLLLARYQPNLVYLLAFIVLFAVGFGGITPVYASTVAELYPGRHLGKMFGLLDIGYGAGSALGPYAAGWIFDHYGSYERALWMLLGLTVLLGLALYGALTIRPRRQAA